MKPGLADMKNAVVVPHIASASKVPYPFCFVCFFWFCFVPCNRFLRLLYIYHYRIEFIYSSGRPAD
jgi:hypothetical protein